MDEQIKAIDDMILRAGEMSKESSGVALDMAESALAMAQALVAVSQLRPRKRPPAGDKVSPGLNFGLTEE